MASPGRYTRGAGLGLAEHSSCVQHPRRATCRRDLDSCRQCNAAGCSVPPTTLVASAALLPLQAKWLGLLLDELGAELGDALVLQHTHTDGAGVAHATASVDRGGAAPVERAPRRRSASRAAAAYDSDSSSGGREGSSGASSADERSQGTPASPSFRKRSRKRAPAPMAAEEAAQPAKLRSPSKRLRKASAAAAAAAAAGAAGTPELSADGAAGAKGEPCRWCGRVFVYKGNLTK